ncbi:hypothetical protein BaRGS_00035824 [Batillaria attramentaria]|uniref:Uncharacterized protein n=1 Tax=Batillaria attramentaria TaxID=370345 RepID=A0ABD0JDJ0_9CAEN
MSISESQILNVMTSSLPELLSFNSSLPSYTSGNCRDRFEASDDAKKESKNCPNPSAVLQQTVHSLKFYRDLKSPTRRSNFKTRSILGKSHSLLSPFLRGILIEKINVQTQLSKLAATLTVDSNARGLADDS